MNIQLYPNRPPLKWPGGKYKLCDKIIPALPKGKVLIEPFAGAGAIFLNTDYKHYIINDINSDLIALYKYLKANPKKIISSSAKLFNSKYNNKNTYYKIRNQFNQSTDKFERSTLFIYLNRHGYNGLCRYNLKGEYNVPFGSYLKPYFPENELYLFSKKAKKATFFNKDFGYILKNLDKNDVVYCDPPYVPLNESAYFTSYSGNKFGISEQERLNKEIRIACKKGVKVVLSNHNTAYTRKLYTGASFTKFKVRRNISCDSKARNYAQELLAIFGG